MSAITYYGGSSSANGNGAASSVIDFNNSNHIIEKGAVIHQALFKWDTETLVPKLQIIDNNIGTIPTNEREIYVNNLNISKDTDFILTLKCTNQKIQKKTSILFRNKIFYGAFNKTNLTPEEIQNMDYKLQDTTPATFYVDCNDEYIYIIAEYKATSHKIIVQEFQCTAWENTILNLTNKHGYTTQYIIYKSIYKQHGRNIKISIY